MYPRKVLYVEDNEGDIKIMKDMADSNKFEIIAETNGEKAIEIIQNDKLKHIKAILLDLELLEPTTKLEQILQGDKVAKKIKEIRPEIPIFIVSKHVGKEIPFIGCYPKEEKKEGRNSWPAWHKIILRPLSNNGKGVFCPGHISSIIMPERWIKGQCSKLLTKQWKSSRPVIGS